MKANEQGNRCRFLGPIVVLLFLMGTIVIARPSTPTLAGPPDPEIPQPEPFYIHLDQPLIGPGVAESSSVPVHVATNPGSWYNLMAQTFEDSSFPPGGWQLTGDDGWQRWSGAADPKMDTASAGITDTTALTDSWLVYGPTNLLAVSDIANAKFEFSFWLDSEKDSGWFGWAASTDGRNFYGARISGSVGQWLTGRLDMVPYLGDDSVWVAFFFLGGGPGNGVYVDNVTLQGVKPFKVYLPSSMKDYTSSFTFTDDFGNVNSGWPHKVNWGSSDSQKKNVYGYTNKLMADYPGTDSYHWSVIGGDCRKTGKYFVRVGTDYGDKIIARGPVQVGAHFTIEADIAFCDDDDFASTGILFGLNDAGTQYYRVILIYDRGGSIKYAVWQDDWKILRNTRGSDHLKWEGNGFNTNRVKIERDGCNLSIYFNGGLEWSTTTACSYTDQRWVGIFHDKFPGHGNTGALVDNFVVENALLPSD
jgi:hypothetical protein